MPTPDEVTIAALAIWSGCSARSLSPGILATTSTSLRSTVHSKLNLAVNGAAPEIVAAGHEARR
jgi:hypothetical protein